MDPSDRDNACLVEETTTLIFEGAANARQRRMEIRRFKKISSSPVPARGLSFVHQGVFKRSRPLRTSSICSMCYHENDPEEDCGGFPVSKISDEQSLPFLSRLVAEIEVPQAFSEGYPAPEGDLLRESGLVRSKSVPPEYLHHTGQCIVHITTATHEHAAVKMEGHFLTVVSDDHRSTFKESSKSCTCTAESTSSLDRDKSSKVLAGMLPIKGSSLKELPLTMPQRVGEVVTHLSPHMADGECKTGDIRSSAGESSELDAQMSDPADKGNVTPGQCEIYASNVSTSSFSLAEPSSLVRCPLSGKVGVCGRRREMEDTAIISPSFTQIPCNDAPEGSCDLHFFAVYDGHGGAQASNYCAERLHHALAEELASSPVSEGMQDDSEWTKVMKSCFLKVDKEVGGVCPNGACDDVENSAICCENAIAPENVGTTAVITVLSPSQIVIANCGDSRAVLSRGGVAIPLSKDHKPERDDETSRIEAAGGRVIYWDGYRVAGLLAVSRALGDRYLKQFVISEPDVLCLPRTDDDECLILASDGLWDVVSNDTACDVARRCLASAHKRSHRRCSPAGEDTASASVAALLVKLAYGRGSKDNISVVVIDLKSRLL